jgi:hypothetical protein
MRKIGIVLAALACLSLMAFPASAAKGDMAFGLTGGMAMPMGNFSDIFKPGIGVGVYGDYLVTEQFAIGVDGMYNQHSAKDEWNALLSLLAGVDIEAKWTTFQFGAHGKWMPPMKDSPAAPYVAFGAGMYNLKAKVEGGGESGEASLNKIGVNGGLGVDFKVNPQFTIGVGGAFHHVMTEGDALQYFNVGVKLGFMTTGATK